MTTKGILGHGLVETGLVFLPDSGGGHDTGRPARKAFMELGGQYDDCQVAFPGWFEANLAVEPAVRYGRSLVYETTI